jgi:hypothetical protein
MLAIASRPGTCALCRSEIISGELIRQDDTQDAWVHARCDEAARSVRHRQRSRGVPRPQVDHARGIDRGRPARGGTGRLTTG